MYLNEKMSSTNLPKVSTNSKLLLSDNDVEKSSIISGSVMDELTPADTSSSYTVMPIRWIMLMFFVLYSASNSLQWTQYTIISDIVTSYYGVPSTLVSWTSMVYMVTYVPLIFPGSWLLDKTVSHFS